MPSITVEASPSPTVAAEPRAFRDMKVNPANLAEKMIIQVSDKGDRLVTKWTVAKTSLKKARKGAAIGLSIGAIFGTAAGVVTIVVSRKLGGKIISLSTAKFLALAGGIGGLGGAVVGGCIGLNQSRKTIRVLRGVEKEINFPKETICEIVKAFFATYFKSGETRLLRCPISCEMMAIPIEIPTCGHTFDLDSLAGKRRCPLAECRKRFSPRNLTFNTKKFAEINRIVREALNILSDAVKIDFRDPERIVEIFNDETEINIGSDTVDRIRNRTITPLEAVLLARYLTSGFVRYNEMIDDVFRQIRNQLSKMSGRKTITREGCSVELEQLTQWRDAYRVKI